MVFILSSESWMRMIPLVSRICAVLFPGPLYYFLMMQQITVDIEAEFSHSSSDFLLSKGVSIYVGVHTHVCVGCGVQKKAASVIPRKATRSLLGPEPTNSARPTSQWLKNSFIPPSQCRNYKSMSPHPAPLHGFQGSNSGSCALQGSASLAAPAQASVSLGHHYSWEIT